MKGWQNQYEITQKVKRNDEYIQRIMYFENNEFQLPNKIDDFVQYSFPQSECFSLGQLIESMNLNFIKIYKGQALIIMLEVLKHVQQLHQQEISHGKLIPSNIIIQLQNSKDNKLTIIQTKFSIKKVYFINYSLIDDSNYQINYLQDVDQLMDSFILFIQVFKNQQCQLFQVICNTLNDHKNDKKKEDLQPLIDFLNLLIKECVDQESQKLKKGQISFSNLLNDSTIQNINYQEGEEFGFFSKRYRQSTLITSFIENLNQQSVACELKHHNNNNNKNYEEPIQLFDCSKLKDDEKMMFNVFEQIIRQQMMKIIWNQLGVQIESWENLDEKCAAIVTYINQKNNDMLNNKFDLILQELKNVSQILDQIKEEIEKSYKFDITYDEQIAKNLFIQEFKIQSQYYLNQDIQAFINTIKTNVKSELQNYYDQIVMIEILQIENEII